MPTSADTSTQAGREDAWVFRPVGPSDAGRMHAFLLELSLRSVQQRFWSGGPNLLRLTRELTREDPHRHGVVACDRTGAIVAHAEYVLIESGAAEVAIVVADRHQGRGLGSRLVKHLTIAAATSGVTRFMANVHPDNSAMLRVFTRRFGATVRQFGDEATVTFALAPPALRDVA
ncbi:MAG TPA: GNAT family N-acetyltransferase [Solirubrobacteraceae bacterium]|nr:GNAT family N-acetyltransferase [Solirubrobacteraceae bacterium]